MQILHQGKNTYFGREHRLHEVTSVRQYLQNDLLTTYEDLFPYLERIMQGERDVLFKGKPDYMVMTSGTTSYAKYIPLHRSMIRSYQYGSFITLINLILETGKVPWGKSLFISPPTVFNTSKGITYGRIPAILNAQLSDLQKKFIHPSRAVLNIADNEFRYQAILEECRDVSLKTISGMPSWLCGFFRRVEELSQVKPIALWPELKFLMVGGTSSVKYQELLAQAIGRKIDLVSSYIATEGFIGIGCKVNAEQYFLNLRNNIFYEFVPAFPKEGQPVRKYGIQDISVGVDYNLVLTDLAGKWSYNLKDVIRFSSLKPYIFEILGRSNNELSVAGEHLLEAQVQSTLANLKSQLERQGIVIFEYIVRGIVTEQGPLHQWAIEISGPDKTQTDFLEKLIDAELQQLNYMYRNLRQADQLRLPEVLRLPPGTFKKYFSIRQKPEQLHKLPAIMADPDIWEFLRSAAMI